MRETQNVTHQRCRLTVDMTKNYRYPNIVQSIWILILLNILQWVLFIPRYIFLRVIVSRDILLRVIDLLLFFYPAVSSLMRIIPYGLILMRGLKRAKASLREICPLVPVRLSLLFPMVLTIIGVFMLRIEINYWVASLLSPPEWYIKYRSLDAQIISFWDSVDSVIVAPLVEELLVRGLILHGFLSRYRVRKAILASALLFGLMHLDPWHFIGPTIAGILYAWWFIETRSILPCFVGHALHNALVIACRALVQSEIVGYQRLWWNLGGVILTALGIWLLVHQFWKSRDTVPEDVSGDKPEEL